MGRRLVRKAVARRAEVSVLLFSSHSSLPADKNSVKSFDKFIVDYIIKFQKMHF